MYAFIEPFSGFDPSLAIREQWAAVKRPGSNWGFSALLKDTYDMQLMGRAGMEPGTGGPLPPLSYSRPVTEKDKVKTDPDKVIHTSSEFQFARIWRVRPLGELKKKKETLNVPPGVKSLRRWEECDVNMTFCPSPKSRCRNLFRSLCFSGCEKATLNLL